MVPDRKGPPMTDAHVSLQDFRRRLRRHLPGGPDGGGAPWLDGLVMEHLPSGNVLRITFPHIYFARWFAPHETDFSAAVNAAWPDDVAPRLEYVLHGQPLPWRPAPQAAPFRIPDILFLHAGGSGDDAPLPGGARNAFPLALARAVVLREPGHSPFLLHGEKGTGKSHLLHHMAAALARQGLRVILAPAARFFRHCPPGEQTALLFWQQADALFLDDIQALDGQPRAQRLLAALLAHRPDAAPAVLALEGGPHVLGTWEPGPAASVRRLLSAELTPPDMEARMRYLQQCCRENALDLPREHLRLMARRAAHFRGLRSLLLRARCRPAMPDTNRSWPRPRAAVTPPPPTSRARGATHGWSWRGRRPCTSVTVIWASPIPNWDGPLADATTVPSSMRSKRLEKCWKVTKMCNALSPDWRNAHIRNSRTAPPGTDCSGRRRAVLKGMLKKSKENSLLHTFCTKAQASIITRILL